MVFSKNIDDIVKKLLESVPPGLSDLKEDLEKNFRSVLQSSLAKLDLVTREEFDAQLGVLQRTREKVEALEKQLKELERQTKSKQHK